MRTVLPWVLGIAALLLLWTSWGMMDMGTDAQLEQLVQHGISADEAAEIRADEQAATTSTTFMWVAVVGLGGIVVGGIVGAVIVLRRPKEDELLAASPPPGE